MIAYFCVFIDFSATFTCTHGKNGTEIKATFTLFKIGIQKHIRTNFTNLK